MKKILGLILVIFSLLSVEPAMAAGPMLRFTPSTGSYVNGDNFSVTIGIDSGTEKVQAVDVWATFDATKLEVVSVVKASSPAFVFDMGEANIYNSAGKFDLTISPPAGGAAFEATAVSGDLAVVTFKAKATGTANVNFTCQAGSSIDSNIFNISTNDVINCALNVNGVYTITAGGGGTTADPTATPGSSTTTTTTSTTSEELPQTGAIGTTLGLLIFGLVGVLSSLALRFL